MARCRKRKVCDCAQCDVIVYVVCFLSSLWRLVYHGSDYPGWRVAGGGYPDSFIVAAEDVVNWLAGLRGPVNSLFVH